MTDEHAQQDIDVDIGLEQMLNRILTDAVNLVRARDGSLMLESEGELRFYARFGSLSEGQEERTFRPGEGVAGWVAQEGEPYVCRDTRKDPHFIDIVTGDPIRSLVSVPILSHERVVLGVINVDSGDLNRFSDDDAESLMILANQAGATIEWAERATQLERLQKVTAAIAVNPSDLDQVLRLVVESLSEIFPRASCAIRLYDSKTDEFTPQVATGVLQDLIAATPRPKGVGTSQFVIATRVPRYLEGDELTSPPDGGPSVRKDILNRGVKAAAYIPLFSGEDIIGILYVDLTTSHHFSRNDKQILNLFADQAEIAIENARQRTRDIAALQEVNAAITTESQESISDLIVQRAQELTQADYSGLWLVTGDRLVLGSMYGTERLKAPDLPIDKRSINGWVAMTGKPYKCLDVDKDPHYRTWRKNVQSSMAVPLKLGERVVGTLGVESIKPSFFTDYHLRLLQSLGEQAAISIRNAQLYKELAHKTRQLDVLRGIYEEIIAVGVGEVDDILDTLYEEASKVMDLGDAIFYVAFYDDVEDEVSFGLVVEKDDGEKIDEIRWGERGEKWSESGEKEEVEQWATRSRRDPPGLTEYVIKSEGPVLITHDFDLWAKDTLGAQIWPKIGRHSRPTLSWLGVPMIVGDEVIGMISLQSLEHERAFNKDHSELLAAVANQAAVAIKNARLYQNLDSAYKDLKQEQKRRIAAEKFGYLGTVAAGLAHRLNSLAGLVNVCREELHGLVDLENEDIRENLEVIAEETAHMLALAEGLFKPTQALEERMRPTDVNLLLKDAVSKAYIPPSVDLEWFYADNLPMVPANKWFVEMFVELITNAVKAMDKKGKLEIESKLADDWVEVRFKDTGCGIPPEDQDRIFDLFFAKHQMEEEKQLGETRERHVKGFGFGLWWINTFLLGIGGNIGLISEVGEGSTFVVRLPTAREEGNDLRH